MQGTTAATTTTTPSTGVMERNAQTERLASRSQRATLTDTTSVESRVERIRVSRLAFGQGKVARPHFDLGADLQEVDRRDGVLGLKFVLYLDTFPSVQRVEMHGVATVRSPQFTIQDGDLEGLSEGFLGQVAMEIFRNHFESVYLLFDTMGLPTPSPWVVKDVRLLE